MKKIIAGILTLTTFLSAMPAKALPLDMLTHWAANAVNTLMENGVITGYEDGTFRPEKSISREEALSLFYRFLKIKNPEIENEDKSFMNIYVNDLYNTHWSAEAIKYIVAQGMFPLLPSGDFYPYEPMTREDVCVLIYQYSIDKFPVVNNISSFTDTVRPEIIELAKRNVVSGYPDGSFKPNAIIKRGEFAMIMSNICGFDIIPVPTIPAPPAPEPIPEAEAVPEATQETPSLPAKNVIDVPYISQLSPVYAVVGCEPTSLLMGMKAKGYALDIDLRTFLDNMPKTTSNPAKGFVGSPYVADKSKKTRTTIYPPILAQYASQYGNVSDFSGSSVEDIRREVLLGNPVVAYCTMRWEKPFYRKYNIEGETQTLLSNNHVILVCGYDSTTNQYYIADPYNVNNTSKSLYYWIDGSTFEPIYNERKHALVVR